MSNYVRRNQSWLVIDLSDITMKSILSYELSIEEVMIL